MKRFNNAITTATTTAIIVSIFFLCTLDAVENLQLQILHNNDMHGRFAETSQTSGTCKLKEGQCYGGFARVAHLVRRARKEADEGIGPRVLYLNAGDTFTGTSWFSVHKWRIAADFLNRLQPDCISLGNHEFDYGAKELKPFLHNLRVPLVTANVDLSTEPQYDITLNKSLVLTVQDTKIGIIGYLLPDTKILASTENVTFYDEIASIKNESEKLDAIGVKIIIAVGHSGFEMDKKIAKQVPLVDLVVGGHTNTFLYNGKPIDLEEPEGPYPFVVTQEESGKKVPVVQAYAYTKYLGRLNTTFDDEGNLIEFVGQPILLKPEVPQAEDILEVLEIYKPAVLNATSRKIGYSKVSMLIDKCRVEECNFGNLIADSLVEYMARNYAGHYWTDCSIAVINSGAIRSSIDIGDILNGDVLSALPFELPVFAFSLRGTDFREMLETSIRSNGETSRGEFLQMSGIKVVYDTRKPVGQRVQRVDVRCANCQVPVYEPLKDNQTYRLIASNFILSGGDGYSVLQRGAFNKTLQDLTESEMVIQYMGGRHFIYPEVSGRITFLDRVKSASSGATKGQILNTIYLLALQLMIVCSISFRY